MMLVKTYLSLSKVDGIGLFASEPIRKDTVIWRFNPIIDLLLTDEQMDSLSEASQELIRKYSYRHRYSRLYLLCADDMRFMNHSSQPNCLDVLYPVEPDITIALKDIDAGEELTCDYAIVDQDLVDGKYQI